MKIILEEQDLKYIDRLNKYLEKDEDIPLFINKNTHKISLSLEVDDVAKANAFILYMMSMGDEQIIRDTLGVNVLSVDYKNARIERAKEILSQALNELDNL